jgi:hypothetical protein
VLLWSGPKERLPRTSNAPFFGIPLRCIAVGNRFLLFATPLDEEAFQQRFGRLESVF